MACGIDNHPHAAEIAGWLRQGLTGTALNDQVRKLDPEHKDFSSPTISRHRMNCLGMVKLAKGRAPRSNVTAEDVKAIRIEDVTPEEIKKLALRTFYARLKLNPADVGMKELVSVIGALSKGKEGPDTQDAITKAMANLDD